MKRKSLAIIATLLIVAQTVWADTTVTTEGELRSALETSQTVTLGADIVLNAGRLDIVGQTVTLNLNGHELRRPMTAVDAGGQVLCLRENGKLTITDKADNSGTITGGWANQGAGIYVFAGCELTLSGGTITGNRADQKNGGQGYGGGVEVQYGGTMTMTGGVIRGNTAIYGGGIYMEGNESNQEAVMLTMTGGTITGNSAAAKGGGIYQWYCTVKM